MEKIACVIVTYNRKELLKNCLNAINLQSYKPSTVFIVDNASTDGTIDDVKKWGYYESVKNDIQYRYILNSKNEGSAGGFYLGMKTAYDFDAYDAIWVMDDDGVPNEDCLEKLVPYLRQYDYIAPIVLAEENTRFLAFQYKGRKEADTVIAQYGNKGVIENFACPFNGILYSSNLIKSVGFPKKDMFIWGDETNYHLRCLKNGFNSITVTDAFHIHPTDRQKYRKILRWKFLEVDSMWKFYCFNRNEAYNRFYYISRRKWLSFFVLSILYYCFFNTSFEKVKCLTEAMIDGAKGDFSKREKYMKRNR